MNAIPANDFEADEGFQGLLNRMMATPTLNKLEAFAADWRALEAEEQAHVERQREALSDAYWEARAANRDEGDEVAA